MQRSPEGRYLPHCFFDDDPEKIGTRIHGLPVYGPISALPERIGKCRLEKIDVAMLEDAFRRGIAMAEALA